MSNKIKLSTILFILAHTIAIFPMFNLTQIPIENQSNNDIRSEFSDIEKEVISHCSYNELILIGKTNTRNYELIHNWINKKSNDYFDVLKRDFFKSQLIKEKIDILEKGLNFIKERDIQKMSAAVMYNKNPNVFLLKIAVSAASGCIQKELDRDINYYKQTRYATIFWNFLASIKKNHYISKDDKREIFKLISKDIKKLEVSCVVTKRGKITIEDLLHGKNRLGNCIIF